MYAVAQCKLSTEMIFAQVGLEILLTEVERDWGWV